MRWRHEENTTRLAAFAAALGVTFGPACTRRGSSESRIGSSAAPEASATPGRIRFGVTMPTAGRYRLFLRFRHNGLVRIVAHTLKVSHG